MKLTKINRRGFSHDILLVLIVAITAIAGVGYMVGSHANGACTKKQIAKGICKSKAASRPASRIASSPMSGAGSSILSCTIKGIPNTARANQTISPSVYVYNYGRSTAKPKVNVTINSYGSTGASSLTYVKTFSIKKLKANNYYKIKLQKSKVAYRTNSVNSYQYTASGPGYYCTKTLQLPFVPANKS